MDSHTLSGLIDRQARIVARAYEQKAAKSETKQYYLAVGKG